MQQRSLGIFIFTFLAIGIARPVAAQQQASGAAQEPAQGPNRIFGVLPNYTTVERDRQPPPITTKQRFQMATFDTFDPFVYPFVGFTAGLAFLEKQEPTWLHASGYFKHYGAAFTDNAVGNMLTTAVVPTIVRQDPRYFVLGEGGFWRRAGYAASRSVVTRGSAGNPQFNISEIGGNTAGAALSNLYYPSSNRSIGDTMQRAAMQVMWDTAANELKEFWPDIRRVMHHH